MSNRRKVYSLKFGLNVSLLALPQLVVVLDHYDYLLLVLYLDALEINLVLLFHVTTKW